MKLSIRSLATVALVSLGAAAFSQFDGPAPLAWRWQQPSSVAMNGSPLVDGNMLYINLGRRMYAVDKESGNQVWKFPNVEPLTGTLRRSPIRAGSVLIIATDDKKVFGVDVNTGSLKWTYEAPGSIVGQPILNGKNVTLTLEGSAIMIVDAESGQPEYEVPYRMLDGISGPVQPTGRDSVAFFDNKNNLRSVNLATRKQEWVRQFGARPADGALVASEGILYTYSGNYLIGLNMITGAPKVNKILPETMVNAPTVGNGNILCVSRDGKAYVFDLAGNAINRKPIELNSVPAVQAAAVGSKFIVPTSNGAICLVDPAQPNITWQYFVRPMNDAAAQASSGTTSPGGPGGGFGGGPGGGGIGGGGFGGGGAQGGRPGGGLGGGTQNNAPAKIIALAASATPILAGKTLLVPAADGSLLAFDKDLGIDLTSPTVKQSWPTPGEIINGQNGQEFIFRIDDEASGVDIKSVTLDIDGKPYSFEYGRDGFLICTISSARKNNPLATGRHMLTVTAKDWLGNLTIHKAVIRVDGSLKLNNRTKDPNSGGPAGPGGGAGGGKGGGGFGGGFGDGR